MNTARADYLAKNLRESMAAHQISGKGTIGFSLPVIVISCDNEFIAPGSRGVLTIIEQGTNLRPSVNVFRRLKDDHTLDAPVTCANPVFTYAGAF